MTTAAMAGARLSAALGPCPHLEVEPVELSTGEIVATVCVRCFAALPAEWGCEDCSYVEDTRLCSPVTTRMLAARCDRHGTDGAL